MMKVRVKLDGSWVDAKKVTGLRLTRKINGLSIFSFAIEDAGDEMYELLGNGTEVNIVDEDLDFLGIVRKVGYRGNDIKVEGIDYAYILKHKLINANDTQLEDSSLSDGYTVVYNNVEFRDVVIDILRNSGITADSSSVDAFGNINIKFKNTFVLEGIQKLAELSGYYWWVDKNKKLWMKSNLGSSSVVAELNLWGDSELLNKFYDMERMCNRALVWGGGNAFGQAEDSSSISSYGLHEKRFKFPELRTDTECTQRAQRIVEEFKDPILIIRVRTMRKGYDLGDLIRVKGKAVDGEYRISRIDYGLFEREVELTTAGLRHRSDDEYEALERLLRGASSDVMEITTGDKIEELVYSYNSPASNENYWRFRFYIDPEKISDILKAKLYVVRDYIPKVYGSETDFSDANLSQSSHDHDQRFFSRNEHQHDQTFFSQEDHTHDVSGRTTGFVLGYLWDSVLFDYDDSTYVYGSNGEWVTVCGGYGEFGLGPDVAEALEAGVNITDQSSTGVFYYKVRLNVGCGYYPNYDGVPVRIEAGKTGSAFLRFPTQGMNCSSIDVRLEVYVPYGTSAKMSGYMMALKPHKHEIEGYTTEGSRDAWKSPNDTQGGLDNWSDPLYTIGNYANITDNEHRNPLSVDVEKYDDGRSHSVSIYIDGNYVGSQTLSGLGSSFEIDISSYITSAGWHYIELRPDGDVFLGGQVKVNVFKVE